MSVSFEGTRIATNEGPDGPFDRIYQRGTLEKYELVNADQTTYKGKIHRRTIIRVDLKGNNFRYPCFETEDGRWFDRGGMPMPKPKKEDYEDDREETGKDTEEGIQASSETQDEESLQGSNENDSVVATVEERKINEEENKEKQVQGTNNL